MGDPTRMSAQVPLDLLRKQKDQRNPAHATIIMPINFEGSTSLKAESVFVSMHPEQPAPITRMASQITKSSHVPSQQQQMSQVSSSMQLPGLSVHLSKQDTLRMSS